MSEAVDERFTIRPHPFRFIMGTTSRVTYSALARFVATDSAIIASDISSMAAPVHFPALLTRMSISPKAWTARSTTARAAAESEMSPPAITTFPPAAVISSARVSARGADFR
jgi:hypothetical protein